MEKIILFLCVFISVSLYSQNPTFDWVAQLGGVEGERGHSIATDQTGNIFVSGTFRDTTDFDPDPNIYFPIASKGSSDIFVAKFTGEGQLVWAHSFGDYDNDSSDGITVDTFGYVLISGSFGGTVDFDPGINVSNLTAAQANDAFILKLDNNGNFIWVKHFEQGFHDEDITTDKAGNIYATGSFSAIDDFDPGPDTFYINSSGSFDIFVLKLDSNGDFVWAKGMGGEYWDRGHAIDLDAEDNVYITGLFEGIADFDPGPNTYNMWTGGFDEDRGMFITKLDSQGDFVWAKKVGNSDSDVTGHGITTDDLGNSFTTGVFRGEADFDTGANVNILESENFRAFVIKLNSEGSYCWVKEMEGEGKSRSKDIVLDKYNNIYTIGHFDGTVDFDPGTDTFNLNAFFWDTYILKLDSAGTFNWVGSFYGGTGSPTSGPSIDIDLRGNIYTTGSFININDFDPGNNSYELISNGSSDAYLHKMNQPCFASPFISTINELICLGDSVELLAGIDIGVSVDDYLWSTGDTTNVVMVSPLGETSSTYNLTVNYTDDTISCVVTTAINIIPLLTSDTTFQEIISCDSLSIGQTVWLYSNTNGCDSIVLINTTWLSPPDMPELPAEIVIPPNTSILELSVPSVLTATMYEWTIPLGAQLLSGVGTNAITLDLSALTMGGSVCVSAFNECGGSVISCTEVVLDTKNAIKKPYSSDKMKVLIYPNPVDQSFNLHFQNEDHRKVELISVHGKVVHQQDCFNEKILIKTAHLAVGVYSLRIQETTKDDEYWKKIIVLR